MRSSLFFLPLALLPGTLAATVTLNWNLGWKWIAPDGYGRPVVAVNDIWPPPTISLSKGDRLVLHVTNNLGNETSSVHFHGLYQNGQNQMDGPAGVTQCPIPPGSTFTYDFFVNQVGTYWWHSHVHGQIADGFRGPLIVTDPALPFKSQVTGGDLVMTLGDWYHTQAPSLINYYQSAANTANGGPEPIPDTGLLNDGQNVSVAVQPGKTYYLRVINFGNFVGTYLQIDGHNLTIVEVDGVYCEPYTVDKLYLAVAQRYGILFTTKTGADAAQNYLIKAAVDTAMFDDIPVGYNPNIYGYLTYDTTKPLPAQVPLPAMPAVFDDMDLVTSTTFTDDQVDEYKHVDLQIVMDMNFVVINNQTRGIINNITYVPQVVPTLYTARSAGPYAKNPTIYGMNSIPYVIKNGHVVEIIVNNYDGGNHPFHMHGHTFQVIARNAANAGYYTGGNLSAPHPRPLRRDTITVNAGGFVALRYKANNPGVHLFHCHIEWHVEAGLTATLIESPDLLAGLPIPFDHIDACHRQGIPTWGNAAGNQLNYLNTTGAPSTADLSPMGAVINASQLAPPQAHWPSHRKHDGSYRTWQYAPERQLPYNGSSWGSYVAAALSGAVKRSSRPFFA